VEAAALVDKETSDAPALTAPDAPALTAPTPTEANAASAQTAIPDLHVLIGRTKLPHNQRAPGGRPLVAIEWTDLSLTHCYATTDLCGNRAGPRMTWVGRITGIGHHYDDVWGVAGDGGT